MGKCEDGEFEREDELMLLVVTVPSPPYLDTHPMFDVPHTPVVAPGAAVGATANTTSGCFSSTVPSGVAPGGAGACPTTCCTTTVSPFGGSHVDLCSS